MTLAYLNRLFDTFTQPRPRVRIRRPKTTPKKPSDRFTLEELENRATPSTSLLTNQLDYAPGANVLLYGGGFLPGEVVQMRIESTSGAFAEWQVTDGGANDLDAVMDGNFATSWNVGFDNVGATLTATAAGLTSGATAQAMFTDAKQITVALSDGTKEETGFVFDTRLDVYIQSVKNSDLAAGAYYVRVVGGPGQGGDDNILGVSTGAVLNVDADHAFDTVQVWSLVHSPTDGSPGFDLSKANTPVYKVLISQDSSFPSDSTARDEFKLNETLPPPPVPNVEVTISGTKFVDRYGNDAAAGIGSDDAARPGWTVNLTDSSGVMTPATTDGSGNYIFTLSLVPGTTTAYTVTEELPGGWTPTYGVGGYSLSIRVDTLGTVYTTLGSNPEVAGAPPALNFANFENVMITGRKYYDANANGKVDDNSLVVANYPIQLVVTSGALAGTYTTPTDSAGYYSFGDLDHDGYSDLGPGTYLVDEGPAPAGWIQTYGIGGYTIHVANPAGDPSLTGYVESGGVAAGNDFANLHLEAARGAVTLGYWSNKKGQAILAANDAAWRGLVNNSLYLRNPNGTRFTVPSMMEAPKFADAYKVFRTWLLNATATNMAYMLSAQLVTTALSVEFHLVSGSTLVDTGTLLVPYASSISGLNVVKDSNGVTHGFITISDLMTVANAELRDNGYTVKGSHRAFQNALEITLDLLNNNRLLFVSSIPPVVWL